MLESTLHHFQACSHWLDQENIFQDATCCWIAGGKLQFFTTKVCVVNIMLLNQTGKYDGLLRSDMGLRKIPVKGNLSATSFNYILDNSNVHSTL